MRKDRMSERMLWGTIDEQKRKIADLEQDLEHKKIAIRSWNARIKELEETCKDLSDKFDFQVKRVMQLESQIEKMRCCENCKYNSYWGNELHCNYGLKEALQEDKLVECNGMDKWEITEND